MSLTLNIDAGRWRAHQDSVLAAEPATVPVAKGNGYGFGNDRLAHEATRLGVSTLAVGTSHEATEVRDAFAGDLLVLTPWHPRYPGDDRAADADARVIRTVAHADAIVELAQRTEGARVVVEVRTSMNRHGISPQDLQLLVRPLESLDVEGFALHLPLDRHGGYDPIAEVDAWAGRLADAGLAPKTLWVSHLNARELGGVRAHLPGMEFKPRTGTRLWLGDRDAFDVHATVLDVHQVHRGDRVGYRQRRATRDGHLVIVTGGTAHGIGLEAPRSVKGIAGRGKAVARGGLEATGQVPSPFRYEGKRLWFAEPPHMQVSMLWLPKDVLPPEVGSTVGAEVRMTTTLFDRVTGLI